MKVGGNAFTRNHRQLLSMDYQATREIPDVEESLSTTSDNSEGSQDLPSDTDTSCKSSSSIECTIASPKISPQLRRSARNRRPPDWILTSFISTLL